LSPPSQSPCSPSPSIASLAFASCLGYSPFGTGAQCEEGRALRARLKSGDERFLAQAAVLVWRQCRTSGRFGEFFGPGVLLVPLPRSQPAARGPWVGERLSWYLAELGLAEAVWPLLRRCHGVRKSAFAPAGERPSVLEHYASFGLQPAAVRPQRRAGSSRPRVLLVDDVVTRGRTLLAAAARVREALPGWEVRGFALLRTLERAEHLGSIVDPCEGEVRWLRGDARRVP
jgi:hypothetical protein